MRVPTGIERNGYDVIYWSGIDTHRYGGMLMGDLPPETGDTRGQGEQLPGMPAVPHPLSVHDVEAAGGGGGVKSNPTAGGGGGGAVPPGVARRLQQIEGHVRGAPNQTDDVKQRQLPQIDLRGCHGSGSMLGVSGGVQPQCTAAQVAERQARRPKLFLSVGHDEYWSGQQRRIVAAARDDGVSLAFFSGNEMYWRIRWESSIVDGADYRTVVVYKDSQEVFKLE